MTFFSRAIFFCVYTTLIFVLYVLSSVTVQKVWRRIMGLLCWMYTILGREVLFICFQTALLTTCSSSLVVQKFHSLNHLGSGLLQVQRTPSSKKGRNDLNHNLRALTIKMFYVRDAADERVHMCLSKDKKEACFVSKASADFYMAIKVLLVFLWRVQTKHVKSVSFFTITLCAMIKKGPLQTTFFWFQPRSCSRCIKGSWHHKCILSTHGARMGHIHFFRI